jgi:hypothetical protein
MKTFLIAVLGIAVVVLPSPAMAKSEHHGKRAAVAHCKAHNHHSPRGCVAAAHECKAERADDAEAFEERYGTNANRRNAFGKCVSTKAKEGEDADDKDDEDAGDRHEGHGRGHCDSDDENDES